MCPHCKEPLVAFELDGVEIDRCVGCGGTWLDAGELEWIAEQAGVDPGPVSAALHAGRRDGSRTELTCPRCRRRMRQLVIGKDPAVELDRCPNEHGLWFDRGEVEHAVAAFAEGEEGAVAKFFADLFGHDLQSESKGD
jgi:Zn-finger nucleic acid-binding protein